MCAVAGILLSSGETREAEKEAVRWFQAVRDLGEAHGFFIMECKACMGLGLAGVGGGR